MSGQQAGELSDQEIFERINSVKNWYHRIEIRPGIITPGINDSPAVLRILNIPEDCSGLKVLDLGTRDGFYAFELEKRGANVVAIDYFPADKTGFKVAAELLNSKVNYIHDNIYNISREKYGQFDIVLFLGLLYHLPDPMLALSIIRSVCRSTLYLESYVTDNAFLLPDGSAVPINSISKHLLDIPVMQFFPKDSAYNDYANYWGPNLKCLELMLIENNFEVLEKKLQEKRAVLKCTVNSNPTAEYFNSISRGIVN